MNLQNDSKTNADYLAPSMSELTRRRGGQRVDPLSRSIDAQPQMTRAVARRLLPACVVAPALLWWVLVFGQHFGWYTQETSLILFVYSVTVVFGVIVCLNLRKLSRMDSQHSDAEEQLKFAKEAAETANRFKSAFFANISHEIRTPLTAINGFAELMLDPSRTGDERQGDAQVIRRNGEHLLSLINDILDLSKIEAGKMTVDRILCCPAAIVGDVCSMLRHRATEKGLTLDVKFEGPIPKTIQTDPTRLRQILINLTANAIKFTKEGGVRITVSITPSLRVAKPSLQIKITDSGIGIPKERQESLFEPFVQGDASITRQYGGTGLGLAISRHFSRALGGDIAVDSQPQRGSTFTVNVETGALVDVAVHERPEEAMKTENTFTGPQVRINGTVLVAEDGIDNQALIAARLRQTGLTVQIAPNGQVACDKALAAMEKNTPFDVILMDVQMPVMDGHSATLHLRSKGYRGPIIVLTANAMERDRDKCLNAGCNDFVTKPIQIDKLFKAIGRYMAIVPVNSKLTGKEDASTTATRAIQAQKFYQDLPGEIAQIEEAIDRQDRTRFKELTQLILGKVAAAGLKELAPQAARLFQSADSEPSWLSLREVVGEFAREAQTPTQREAA